MTQIESNIQKQSCTCSYHITLLHTTVTYIGIKTELTTLLTHSAGVVDRKSHFKHSGVYGKLHILLISNI